MKTFIKLWRMLFWTRQTVHFKTAYFPRLNITKMVEEMGYPEPVILAQYTSCDGKTITGGVTFAYRKGNAHNEK